MMDKIPIAKREFTEQKEEIEFGQQLERQKKPGQKDKKRFFLFRRKDRKLLMKKPETSYLITMFFLNGTVKTFVISTDGVVFKFRKKTYYLYYEESFYDLSMQQYHLYYYENCAVPVNREYVKQGDDAFFTVRPENLKELIEFEYVKVLAGAHSFEKMLKIILVVVIITGALALICVLLLWGKSKGA